MTPTEARTQWLAAAHYWRQQQRAREREGKWKDARAAAQEAEKAEAAAREVEERREGLAS